MKLTVTASGKVASGKTRTFEIIRRALLAAGAPVEPIEVVFQEVRNKGPKEEAEKFTVAVRPSGRRDGTQSGHRETYSIQHNGANKPMLYRGNRWIGTFDNLELAQAMMRLLSQPTITSAASHAAAMEGWPTPKPECKIMFRGLPENCQGGGGDFADGAGAISAEMAPALHGVDQ
jgi:hypothetical protein